MFEDYEEDEDVEKKNLTFWEAFTLFGDENPGKAIIAGIGMIFLALLFFTLPYAFDIFSYIVFFGCIFTAFYFLYNVIRIKYKSKR